MFGKKSTKDLVRGGNSAKPPKEKKVEPSSTFRKMNTEDEPEAVTSVKKEPGALFRKSKTLIAALCILLAALLSFVGLPKIYNAQSALTDAVTVRADISVGTVITADMLLTVKVGAYRLPDGVLRSADAAIGMVASEKLYAGEYLWDSRLLAEEDYAASLDKSQSKLISRGHCLITIEMPSVSAGIAGVLRAGDTVDVYSYSVIYDVETDEETFEVTRILTRMPVYDVLNANLISLDALDDVVVGDNSGTNLDYKPAYVVFDCTKDQATVLIELEQEGTLHLTRPSEG